MREKKSRFVWYAAILSFGFLLSVSDNTRNWAIYGTSYATNAGNAQYATSAGNAQQINGTVIDKLTQAQYNALADKTGVYFVTID